MYSIFNFSLKPKYKKTTINYKKSSIKNILRSFYLNKLRFFIRYTSYLKFKHHVNKIKNIEDLNKITSLVRPGKLNS